MTGTPPNTPPAAPPPAPLPRREPLLERRGCGFRIKGGIYWEFLVLEDGQTPIDEYLMDPPRPLPPSLQVPHIGVLTIERGGVTHIIDRVGSAHYPDLAAFWEEARIQGISRRLPRNFEFERLSPESRLLLVHDKAYIRNTEPYCLRSCPKDIEAHDPHDAPSEMCAGLWWEDLTPQDGDESVGACPRQVRRTLPGGTEFVGRLQPHNADPDYAPAIFASVPCSAIAVIAGNDHAKALKKAR